MTTTSADLQKLASVIESKNISIDDAITLIENSKSKKALGTDTKVKLTVDYTRDIDDCVQRYYHQIYGEDINERKLPIPSEMFGKKVEIDACLIYFEDEINHSDVLKEIDKAGFRPANLMELLALGHEYEFHMDFCIHELESICYVDGNKHVSITSANGKSVIQLCGSYGDYSKGSRFLAVPKGNEYA